MSDHDFEKQVRQKLQDLKLSPTPQAWENIEQNLQEKKRRRTPVFWLPLLLIGFGAAGYLLLDNFLSKDGKENIAVIDRTKTDQTAGANQPVTDTRGQEPVSAENNPSKKSNELPVSEHSTIIAEKNIGSATDKKTSGASAQLNPQKRSEIKSNKTLLKSNSTRHKSSTIVQGNDRSSSIVQGNINMQAPTARPVSTTERRPQSRQLLYSTPYNEIQAISLRDNVSENIASTPGIKLLSSGIAGTPTPTKAVAKVSRWSYGLNGSAGISAVNEGSVFSFSRPQVEDVSSARNIAWQAAPSYKASPISPGLAYSIGAFVRRELNDRFALSLSLNYLQLNTKHKVGYEINSRQVVNNGPSGYRFVYNYYTLEQDQPKEYRNRFHFIEVPVQLHTMINRSKKLPININTGMSFSQLLKSNSLHFDGTTGVYYKNDNLLNSTQAAVTAGVSFGILNKTTRPMWIGPIARYNVTNILEKEVVSAKKNFMSLGIDVKMFIR